MVIAGGPSQVAGLQLEIVSSGLFGFCCRIPGQCRGVGPVLTSSPLRRGTIVLNRSQMPSSNNLKVYAARLKESTIAWCWAPVPGGTGGKVPNILAVILK